MERGIRVLILEGDSEAAQQIRATLEGAPRVIGVSTKSRQDATPLEESEVDVALLDLGGEDNDKKATLRRVLDGSGGIPVLVLLDDVDDSLEREAVQRGAQGCFLRDELTPRTLVRDIHHAIERQRLVEELRRATEELRHLTVVDPLTGLLNRRGFEQALARESSWATREASPSVALVLDLDDLKRVNDTLGHTAGDHVLRETAARIRTILRRTDVVARIGGDEFMALLPRTRPGEGAFIAERIRRSLCDVPIEINGEAERVTASLGVVAVRSESLTLGKLLRESDEALYRSKRAGKNRVTASFAAEDTGDSSGLETWLQREDLVEVVGQRIVRLEDGVPIGYEALIRSRVPGLREPDAFFTACRERGLLTEADTACFERCLEEADKLDPALPLHVNLFPSTLVELGGERVAALMRGRYGGRSFCIELREDEVIGDPAYLAESVHALKNAGILVGFDHIGFGKSGLESLILLEPNIVKIEPRWAGGIARNTSKQREIKRLIRIIESLEAMPVIQGVEHGEDRQALIALGARYGQGYLWDPLSS